ncbi:MAG: radical SAM protein, partial [Candidatus Eisenbacteria bacterium]|nr:radical SAM protein [Candidatus Eisenbacteria bacterium]
MPRDVFPIDAPPARIAIGYPNRRAVALGNLGFRTVAQILGACRGVRRERFTLPDRASPREAWEVCSEPSGARLSSMDLVLLSVCFEGDAPHLPLLLLRGGLPPRAGERRAGHPLVIAGGAVVMMNPEPLSDFCDLFLVGEAEALLEPLLRAWHGVRGASRAEQIGT